MKCKRNHSFLLEQGYNFCDKCGTNLKTGISPAQTEEAFVNIAAILDTMLLHFAGQMPEHDFEQRSAILREAKPLFKTFRPDGKALCQIPWTLQQNGEQMKNIAEANAIVMASAPDMLEALEGLLAHRECPINSPEAEIARAAIKKAKG